VPPRLEAYRTSCFLSRHVHLPPSLSVAYCSSAQIIGYSEETYLASAHLPLGRMDSGSRNVLPSTSSMAVQRAANNESEELLMMFSASPESPKFAHPSRHSSALWPTPFDTQYEHGRLSTAERTKIRDSASNTSAEVLGLFYNSSAFPISDLLNPR